MLGRLEPSVAAKLAKVCGLLGSDHHGERSAAAWQATRLLQARGLTWTDVFAPAAARASTPTATAAAPHIAEAMWASQFADRLTDRERKFLADIGRCHRISAKQAAWLHGIVRKLGGGDGV